MSNQNNLLYSAHGTIIRDLCLARDNHYQSPHLLSYTEIVMLRGYSTRKLQNFRKFCLFLDFTRIYMYTCILYMISYEFSFD